MNPQTPFDAKTKKALYEVDPSLGNKTQQPSVGSELMRGNADALDRIHPRLGPGLLILACLLLVVGLWMKKKEKNRPPEDGFAGLC